MGEGEGEGEGEMGAGEVGVGEVGLPNKVGQGEELITEATGSAEVIQAVLGWQCVVVLEVSGVISIPSAGFLTPWFATGNFRSQAMLSASCLR